MPDSPDDTSPVVAAGQSPPPEAATQETAQKATVQGKAVRGAQVLGLRTVVSVILRIVSSLTLARFLTKEDFGIFGIISGIVGIGLFLCEFSLNSVLIAQKEEPEPDETATVFWMQQAISLVIVTVVTLMSSWILHLYKVEQSQILMLCIGIAALFLVTLRSVPGAMMERHLNFEPLARAEVAENIAQIVFSLGFAIAGFGAWSLMISFIVARLVGMVIVRASSDWSLTGRFRWETARLLMHKAIRFQANHIVAISLSSLSSLIISRTTGVAGYGLLTWSANIASAPSMLVNMINRVALPAMSRLQEDPAEVGRVTGRTVRRIVTIMGLVVAPLAIVAPFFLPLIFGEEWRPAIVLFQWNTSEIVLASASGILVQTMIAMELLKARTVIVLISGVLRICLVYGGVKLFGVEGIAGGCYCASLLELLILAYYVRRTIPGTETIWRDTFAPLARVQGTLFITMLISRFLLTQPSQILIHTVCELALYAILVAVAELLSPRRPILAELAGIWNMLRARRVASS
ncbi:MAG: oligosaccharide flippase family protein [Fibrella sp.]|nr:oligosaccharide flippase family protein [Armatimonadota bacterium]